MKTNLLFLCLAFSQTLFAQYFTETPQVPPFEGVVYSSIAFADVDGDNDQDVLITGLTNSFTFISKLYKNGGGGTFTEMTGTPFEGIGGSSIAFADVDGDNDQDVLITGRNSSSALISKLYKNDGGGTFTEMTGTPFDGVEDGSIAFADVDGDNDQDVLITGKNGSGARISKLYKNDGSGTFTEVAGTPFEGVGDGSVAFADVDGDNDQDVLIVGQNGSVEKISKLYKNGGSGNFTEVASTPFDGVFVGSVAFADVDGDNDQDVLILGQNGSFEKILKLYKNGGSGNFTEVTGTAFDGVNYGTITFADVDGDNDQDVLITGQNIDFVRISKLYLNDGSGTFTVKTGTPFEAVEDGSVAFADVDGDNDQDVLITGQNSSGVNISKLYKNSGVNATEDLTIKSSLNFTLFPNPSASGKLYVNYDASTFTDVTIQVYDISGVLLKQQKAFAIPGQQNYNIDISSLHKGIYVIELNDGKRKGVAKFIVQ